MTRLVKFRREAREELLEARDWYEERAVGLGSEFARAIDAVIAAITREPTTFPVVHGQVRRAVIRRFPYQLLFRIDAEMLLIVACFPHRRDPKVWRKRR